MGRALLCACCALESARDHCPDCRRPVCPNRIVFRRCVACARDAARQRRSWLRLLKLGALGVAACWLVTLALLPLVALGLARVRLVPALEGGQPLGFTLHRVRPGSPWSAACLRNGDTLISVNGLRLALPDGPLRPWPRRRVARCIVLRLERDGRPLTLRCRRLERTSDRTHASGRGDAATACIVTSWSSAP